MLCHNNKNSNDNGEDDDDTDDDDYDNDEHKDDINKHVCGWQWKLSPKFPETIHCKQRLVKSCMCVTV